MHMGSMVTLVVVALGSAAVSAGGIGIGLGVGIGVGQPPAPIRSLDYFVGDWVCSGVFPASGKTIASTMRYASDLQGSALLKHHDDTAPSLYHAVEAWGYDGQAKRFNATIMDNFGGARRFGSDGWKQDVLTWSSAADVTPVQRFVYTRLDRQHYRVDWDVAQNGTDFAVGDTLTCNRQ
ncbi:MAG TPA: hypothetical protein VK660_08565 [Xanthomonadaceae bacterium]|jgi:hypothetical protein|nr:hypothetical protein [Xanthomonadaceae bacterium]